MRLRFLSVMVLALVLLVAACGPSAPAAAPTEVGEAMPSGETGNTSSPTEAPAPTEAAAAVLPSPTAEMLEAEEAPQAALAAAAHADAPAEPQAFRFDSGEFVGATGSPQLVEFFTTW